MKILTITCHDVYNTGASLQAYALMKYLQNQGHEVKIIDYKPEYLSHHYSFSYIPNKRYDVFPIKYLYLLSKLPGRINSYLAGRKQNFDAFKKNYLKVTEHMFKSNEELKKQCPKADVVIAGSDQIWNPLFQNGKDKAFYLDFVADGTKKVSYAASMVVTKLDETQKTFVKTMLQDFDKISVREKSATDVLKDMGISAVAVMDPVFLLDSSIWNKLIENEDEICKQPYLFLYDFENDSNLKQFAERLAEKNNLKIISFFDDKNRHVKAAGPIQFLKLIKGADYILSNSFHATAFSVIFEKDFFVFKRKENLNSRMKELLEGIDLTDREIEPGQAIKDMPSIDYLKVNSLLDGKMEQSRMFLKTSIL